MEQEPEANNKKLSPTGSDPAVWFRSYMHGGTSSFLTTITTFPLYKTMFRMQLHNTAIRHAVAQLYKEGALKLYRGVVPPLLMKTLSGMLLFGLQNSLQRQLSPWAQPHLPSVVLPALAGLGTGVVEAVVFTPFERVQNVLQHSGNDRSLPKLRSVLVRFRSEKLASGYYRALTPVLVRNTLGSSLYFGLKNPMAGALNECGLSPVASSFITGMVNSMAISMPLYPLSVLVANMQAQVGGEMLGVKASGQRLWKARQRRLTLLYCGGSLVILRSCITWGITTAIYDHLERRAG